MARTIALIALAVVAVGATGYQLYSSRSVSSEPAIVHAAETTPAAVAAGRVEPASEEVDVAAELAGRLAAVTVEEGDRVQRGQVLAVLEDADYRAGVAAAAARVAQEQARLRRVVNGARSQERHEAAAEVREMEAVVASAREEAERRRRLFEAGVVSREEAERAEREWRVAEARERAAAERRGLVDAPAREEDRAEAEASVRLAEANLAEARARLEKTRVRAPIDGVVLKRHMLAGESVPVEGALPIVTLGGGAAMRIRAEVDETDVAKVRVGQRVSATADAFGERRFSGRVVRVGQMVGRKSVRTGDPAERVDTKVLEVLVELEDGRELPSGLRVDVFFEGN